MKPRTPRKKMLKDVKYHPVMQSGQVSELIVWWQWHENGKVKRQYFLQTADGKVHEFSNINCEELEECI